MTKAFELDTSATETLKTISSRYFGQKGIEIPVLQDMQKEFGYIPKEAVIWISGSLGVAASKLYGIATFYSQFYLTPRGKNIITACTGTACHVKGSDRLVGGLASELGLPEGQETTDDLMFTFERVNCVGACSIAPVFIINGQVRGKANINSLLKEVRSIRKNAEAEA